MSSLPTERAPSLQGKPAIECRAPSPVKQGGVGSAPRELGRVNGGLEIVKKWGSQTGFCQSAGRNRASLSLSRPQLSPTACWFPSGWRLALHVFFVTWRTRLPLAGLENGGSGVHVVLLSNKPRAVLCHQPTHFAEPMGH